MCYNGKTRDLFPVKIQQRTGEMKKIKELWSRLRGKISGVLSGIKPSSGKFFGKKKEPVDEVTSYKQRLIAHRRKQALKTGAVIAIVAALALGIKFAIDHWSFKEYVIINSSEQEDITSTEYVELDGNVFKYNQDDTALMDTDGETLWTGSYDIVNPQADVCGDMVAVYDKNGTSIEVFDINGEIGSINTKLPILKARVSSVGTVAAVLEDGENTWINYYNAAGEEIATVKTGIDSPGYPMDVDISSDGSVLGVSYLYMSDGSPNTKITFYNFESAGKNQMDNKVGEYEYDNILVPQIAYLDSGKFVAFREDGFTVFEGGTAPREEKTVKVSRDIITTMNDGSHIGLIFQSEEEGSLYTIEVYTTGGRKIMEENCDFSYTDVSMGENQIVLYNSSQMCVYSVKGIEKFRGDMKEGQIKNLFQIGNNRYLEVTENGIYMLKLH